METISNYALLLLLLCFASKSTKSAHFLHIPSSVSDSQLHGKLKRVAAYINFYFQRGRLQINVDAAAWVH